MIVVVSVTTCDNAADVILFHMSQLTDNNVDIIVVSMTVTDDNAAGIIAVR